MKTAKLAGAVGALVVAALVGGALIRTVAAESPAATPSSSPGAKGAQYCQTFAAAFAKNLGVDVSALQPAAKSAADATIDAAVANGDLTQAKADAMKKRIADAKGNDCALMAGRFHRLHAGILKNGFRMDLGSAAATALKMEPAALRDALRKGTSLKDVAREAGVAPGLLHYYFESKEELLLEVVAVTERQLIADWKEAIAGIEDPLERIVAGLDHAEDEDRGVVRPGQARRDAGCRFREPGQIRRQKNAQVH